VPCLWRAGGGYLSGASVTRRLKRLYPEAQRAHLTASLFSLAPDGVCPAGDITAAAVRSCRTFSPLPASGKRRTAGGVFSVALSVGSPLPDAIRHRALWSPDFPPHPRG